MLPVRDRRARRGVLSCLGRSRRGSRVWLAPSQEVVMSTGAIIGIIIAVIVVAAVAVVASAQLRRARMRRQFGPEYDRLAKEIGPRKADAELSARQRRGGALGIPPVAGAR